MRSRSFGKVAHTGSVESKHPTNQNPTVLSRRASGRSSATMAAATARPSHQIGHFQPGAMSG